MLSRDQRNWLRDRRTTMGPTSSTGTVIDASPRASLPTGGLNGYATTDNTLSATESFSISAAVPFDWKAARGERPPPFAHLQSTSSGLGVKRRSPTSLNSSTSSPHRESLGGKKERLVRKRSLWERITSWPSQFWFELSMLPYTLSLPPPRVIGYSVAASCHFLHWLVLYFSGPASDEWGDMKQEMGNQAITFEEDIDNEGSWWSWGGLIGWLIIFASISNTLYVFTRFRSYQLLLRKERINSPNAEVIEQEADLEKKSRPPLIQRAFRLVGRVFSWLWNFIFPSDLPVPEMPEGVGKIQQLNIWAPGDTEMAYLIGYSPVHAFLYPVMGWSHYNFLRVPILMAGVSALLYLLDSFYGQLVKDKAILSAEVMHEYDAKFVIPRLSAARKDACVMTHEAEVVDFHHYSNRHYGPPIPGRAIPQRAPQYQHQLLQADSPSKPPRVSGGGRKEILRF